MIAANDILHGFHCAHTQTALASTCSASEPVVYSKLVTAVEYYCARLAFIIANRCCTRCMNSLLQCHGLMHMYVCPLTLYRSYTGFSYSGLKVPEKLSTNDNLNVTVSVTNTGVYDGDEVRMYSMWWPLTASSINTLHLAASEAWGYS